MQAVRQFGVSQRQQGHGAGMEQMSHGVRGGRSICSPAGFRTCAFSAIAAESVVRQRLPLHAGYSWRKAWTACSICRSRMRTVIGAAGAHEYELSLYQCNELRGRERTVLDTHGVVGGEIRQIVSDSRQQAADTRASMTLRSAGKRGASCTQMRYMARLSSESMRRSM